MVVVAIVAILASIAYASYQNQVMKTRRAAATTCLQERAQFMERYYTTNMTYAGAPNPAQCADIANHYTIAFSGGVTATAYSLTATPQGVQATRDTGCGTLSINQNGLRGKTGSGTVDECW